MSKGQFLELWRSIPGVDDASLEMLKGFVLVEDAQPRKEDQMIAYFPKTELSLDPATRGLSRSRARRYVSRQLVTTGFRQLFERRQRWSEADFIPFVEDLVPNKKALDTLLLKFARVSSIPGVGGKMITPRFT